MFIVPSSVSFCGQKGEEHFWLKLTKTAYIQQSMATHFLTKPMQPEQCSDKSMLTCHFRSRWWAYAPHSHHLQFTHDCKIVFTFSCVLLSDVVTL